MPPHQEEPSVDSGPLTQRERAVLTAAEAVYFDPEPDSQDWAYSARQLVQATLPHQNPRGNPPEWYRTNGTLTLSIRPGYKTDPNTGTRCCVGYPYGVIPRLLLFWMTTEVVRSQDRRLKLGDSLSGFMRDLGLNPDNGGTGAKRSDARRLKEQTERLFRATISFDESSAERTSWLDMQVAPKGELWWDPQSPDQSELLGSWIELGEDFYQALREAPVPVDMRTLRALQQSPLALDLYTWLAYRCFTVTQRGKAAFISWPLLQRQMGASYRDPKNFKKRIKETLGKIHAIYPRAKVEDVRGGLKISPGPLLMAPAERR